MDRITMFSLELQDIDWSSEWESSRYKLNESRCYSMRAISEHLTSSHRHVPVIDSIWFEHTVEYRIAIDVRQKQYIYKLNKLIG